jgi:drug/metabolite transporter (DMT)-like permease
MAKFTRILGVTLILLGLIPYLVLAYSGTEPVSITALIPTFFGIVFLVLGVAARKESWYRHSMHGAAVLALLGLFGSAGGLLNVFYMLGGSSVERPDAAIAQAIMAVLCIIYLIAAVRSFIDARKAKEV